MKKAYFLPRVIAYFIDFMLIYFVVSIIGLVIPQNENLKVYQEQLVDVEEKFINEEISANEYLHQTSLITYDIDHANVLSYILEIISIIAYFVIFQFYNKGQTIGKKLMKIRIVGVNDHELTINDYLYRSFVLDSVIVNILIIILVMFMGRDSYFYTSYALQFIQIVVTLITVFMVLFRKDGRGLHDFISKSQVVSVN